MADLKITSNGFVWLLVTDKAKEVFASGLFEVYCLYSDESEALIETDKALNEALENGNDIGIEGGAIPLLARFPNGFNSWQETHFEVVSAIEAARVDMQKCEDTNGALFALKVSGEGGTGRFFELAEEWTDECEKSIEESEDWFHDIEAFVNQKIADYIR